MLLAQESSLPFELLRRLPGIAAVAGLLAAGAMWGRRGFAKAADLPMPPTQVDWVAAAGNYVELHCGGRTILHRASLSQVETELARHGFVRVHRSTLVRRDRIARVRPLDVILEDGTSLRTGNRYRAALRG
jgi:DNA-binding LytR/AlgR family response regulator